MGTVRELSKGQGLPFIETLRLGFDTHMRRNNFVYRIVKGTGCPLLSFMSACLSLYIAIFIMFENVKIITLNDGLLTFHSETLDVLF